MLAINVRPVFWPDDNTANVTEPGHTSQQHSLYRKVRSSTASQCQLEIVHRLQEKSPEQHNVRGWYE
ncbi:hypothetical protein [Pseudoalteromonas rubra]|uniref:hypothetical protein n=1 Tax=Pseudoalteromonas rubra TaxID=43658 RepID=UPI000F78251F|nr:hypothetical protein [Pseudoalteromonas rubra]